MVTTLLAVTAPVESKVLNPTSTILPLKLDRIKSLSPCSTFVKLLSVAVPTTLPFLTTQTDLSIIPCRVYFELSLASAVVTGTVLKTIQPVSLFCPKKSCSAKLKKGTFCCPDQVCPTPMLLKNDWKDLYNDENFPIDAIISPEQEVAKGIFRRLISPGTIDMVELSDKKLKLIGLKCEDNFLHSGLSVRELSEKFPDYLANIMFIFRGDQKFTVNSSTKIEKKDTIFLVVETDNLTDVLSEFGHQELQAKKAVIIGGGNIGFSLAQLIENSETYIKTELIEANKERAEFLASNLENITVTCGDGLDNQILEEVNISDSGYCISITEDDEVNILSSLLAKRAGSNTSITLINNSNYSSLLSNIGVDMTIDPKIITISKILEKVRGVKIRNDYSIGEGFGEVIEADIQSESFLCNKNLKELELPKGIRIGSIVRDKKIIIPNSQTVFKENDDVVFFAETNCIKKLEKLLSKV